MKKPALNISIKHSPDLKPEYRFDYTKSKPNRFADKARIQPVIVALAPDVAKVFKDEESVNAALRSIIKALPPSGAGS